MFIAEDGTSGISLLNSKGETGLGMFVADEQSGIGIYDSEGEIRLGMGISKDKDPFLHFCGPDGEVIRSLR